MEISINGKKLKMGETTYKVGRYAMEAGVALMTCPIPAMVLANYRPKTLTGKAVKSFFWLGYFVAETVVCLEAEKLYDYTVFQMTGGQYGHPIEFKIIDDSTNDPEKEES